MNSRKPKASFGAFLDSEYAELPPMIADGSPWPPATAGNGNQPRSGSGFWSGVRLAITPGSQEPMSSMAALWLASMPAEEPAPCWAAVVRNPAWKGLALRNAARSFPAVVQHGSVNLSDLAVLAMTDWLHSRRAKL